MTGQNRGTEPKPFTDERVCKKPVTLNDRMDEAVVLALSEAIAHHAHDLRSPLNAITGFSEVLSDVGFISRSPDQAAEYASFVHSSSLELIEALTRILERSQSSLADVGLTDTASVDLHTIEDAS